MSLSWPNKGARRHAFVGGELALALPAPQRLRRDPKELGGFVNADHLARYDHNIHYCTKTSNFFEQFKPLRPAPPAPPLPPGHHDYQNMGLIEAPDLFRHMSIGMDADIA